MNKINLVKKYLLGNGKLLGNHLEQLHGRFSNEWVVRGDIVEFVVKISHLKKIYRWEFEGENFYSVNGGSISITPELNKNEIETKRRRSEVAPEDLEIYDYVKQYFLHDGEQISDVLSRASKKFKKPEKNIEEIYLKVDGIIYMNRKKL